MVLLGDVRISDVDQSVIESSPPPSLMPKLKILNKTPASFGYTFPPEWHPHRATWFSWPRPEGISFPDKYHTVPENLARIIEAIAAREEVHINVPNENYERVVTG